MSVINLAFSGGIESTYLLQKLLLGNNRVNIIFANLTGGPSGYLGEMLRAKQIIDWFNIKLSDKESSYSKARSCIGNVTWNIGIPYLNLWRGNSYNNDNSPVMTGVSQQYALVELLAEHKKERRSSDFYPSTVIGWIKEDATEYSLNEYDFTEAEYQELLNFPVRLGRLSNSDLVAKPFRAPLWEMRKIDIWDALDPELKELVLPNGSGNFDEEGLNFIHEISTAKELELEGKNIPYKSTYKIPVPKGDFGFFVRLLGHQLTTEEFGLPDDAYKYLNYCREQFVISKFPSVKDNTLWCLAGDFKRYMKEVHADAVLFAWPEEVKPKGKFEEKEAGDCVVEDIVLEKEL